MTAVAKSIGPLLREWRTRQRRSQLDLALDANISSKHLSFVETGKAQPSREMLLRLAEKLEIPLRERNSLLAAAGFAAVFPQRHWDDVELSAARQAIELILQGHAPHPALALDRHWNLLSANQGVAALLQGVPPEQLQPPINVLRLSLHPNGLAPRILNLSEWRQHVLQRLQRQIHLSADEVLLDLQRELLSYPIASAAPSHRELDIGIVVPLRLHTDTGELSLISTTTVFGTPLDITLSEIAIESFFPADAFTAQWLRQAVAD